MILLFLIAAGVLTVGLLSSLLGEIQGGFSYRHGVQALAVAEAGIHFAVARINETGGTYPGESNRQMVHPTQGVLGVFDVEVRCSNGTVPGSPNPCAVAPQPNERIVSAIGFVPDRTRSLGRRTVVIVLRQAMLTSLDFAVCGRDGVTLDRDTDTYGNVGSNANISLLGPPTTPGSLARTYAYGGQPGNATAGGTVTCSGSCGPVYNQVAGVTTEKYPGGQVCPPLPDFTCSPAAGASGDLNQSNLTISAANANTVLRDVEMEANSTLTFATTSASEILTVHLNTLIVGRDSWVRVTGPGKIVLHMAGRMEIGQRTFFGVDGANDNIDPGRFVLQSCSSDVGTDYAVEFHQTGGINAIILAPNGRVQLDQASLSNGAIQSRSVQFDQATKFTYNTTGFAIGGGAFNTLTSWREQP
ncbi:MAG: hypothetical protein RDU83_06020 [bacterium]|nr:hypothetical protein [bacterium]